MVSATVMDMGLVMDTTGDILALLLVMLDMDMVMDMVLMEPMGLMPVWDIIKNVLPENLYHFVIYFEKVLSQNSKFQLTQPNPMQLLN